MMKTIPRDILIDCFYNIVTPQPLILVYPRSSPRVLLIGYGAAESVRRAHGTVILRKRFSSFVCGNVLAVNSC